MIKDIKKQSTASLVTLRNEINQKLADDKLSYVERLELEVRRRVLTKYIKLKGGQSMLAEIANALQTYNEEGVAVLKRTEEHDAIELAEYVVMVLDALKCSYSYEYDESTGTAILRDDMHN